MADRLVDGQRHGVVTPDEAYDAHAVAAPIKDDLLQEHLDVEVLEGGAVTSSMINGEFIFSSASCMTCSYEMK